MNNNSVSKKGDFCPEEIAQMKRFIDDSKTTTVIGMPGIGISLFLKYLSSQPFGKFIYLDAFKLPHPTSKELFHALLKELEVKPSNYEKDWLTQCQNKIETIIKSQEKVIICFPGFDQFKKSFTKEFFDQLRALRNIDSKNIVCI